MKKCFKCLSEKPETEFYKHSGMTGGLMGKCKECTKLDAKNRRMTNPKVQEYDRLRGNRQSAEYLRGYRARFPKKYKAHCKVGYMVKSGKLTNPGSCESCGSTMYVQAHHDDYDKPEVVRWLCSICHRRWHSDNGEALNAT